MNLLKDEDLLEETGKEYPSIKDSETDSSDSFFEVFDNASKATASKTINGYDTKNVKGMADLK